MGEEDESDRDAGEESDGADGPTESTEDVAGDGTDDALEAPDSDEPIDTNGEHDDSDVSEASGEPEKPDSADDFDNPLEEVDAGADDEFATPLGGATAGETDGPVAEGAETDDDFDNPLEDLQDGVGPADEDEALFAEMEVPDVDEESVWEELAVDTDGTETDAERLLDGEATEPEIVDDAAAGEETVVPKSRYCHRCTYFSAPPEVACSHPGTDIVEVVDLDSFRVRNCPVVERRQGPAQELLSEDS